MAAALRKEWVRPVVIQALQSACKALKSNLALPETIQRFTSPAMLDTVAIRLLNPQQVQVLRIGDIQSHVEVSDAFSVILAHVDSDAIAEFSHNNERHFHEIQGGLIKLNSIDVIFNPNLPPNRRLQLGIRDFTLSGSEGSSVFGAPSLITQDHYIQEAIVMLDGILQDGSSEESSVHAPNSGFRSQMQAPMNGDAPKGTLATSQIPFATQVPTPLEPRDLKSSGIENQPGASHIGNKSFLIGFLLPKRPGVKQPADNVNSEFTAEKSLPKETTKSVLSEVSNGQVKEMTSKLSAKANSQHSEPSSSLSSSIDSNKNSRQLPTNNGPSKEGFLAATLKSTQREKSRETSSAVNATGVDNSNVEVRSKSVKHRELPNQPPFFDQFQISNPFAESKRMSRKYFQVSDEQQKLVDSSWYPVHDDGRSSHANISSSVQNDLNRRYYQEWALGDANEALSESDEEQASKKSLRKSGSSPAAGSNRHSSIAKSRNNDDDSSDQSQESDDEPVEWSPSPEPDNRFSRAGAGLPEAEDNNSPTIREDDRVLYSTKQMLESPQMTPEDYNVGSPIDTTQTEQSQNDTRLPPSAQELGIRQSKPRPIRRPSIPVIFPPSSPGGPEEFEFQVPLAVGTQDTKTEGEVDEEAEGSQELPSPSQHSSLRKRILETPHTRHNIVPNIPQNIDSPSLHEGEHPPEIPYSSLNVIPATFNDLEVVDRSSSSADKERTAVTSSLPVQMLSRSPEEGSASQGHFVGRQSQQQPANLPSQRLGDTAQSRTPSTVRNGQRTEDSAAKLSSQNLNLSPPEDVFHDAEDHQVLPHPSLTAMQSSLKRNLDTGEETRNLAMKKRKRRTIAEMIEKEEDSTPKDPAEMARNLRRSFTESLRATRGNSATVSSKMGFNSPPPQGNIISSDPPLHTTTVSEQQSLGYAKTQEHVPSSSPSLPRVQIASPKVKSSSAQHERPRATSPDIDQVMAESLNYTSVQQDIIKSSPPPLAPASAYSSHNSSPLAPHERSRVASPVMESVPPSTNVGNAPTVDPPSSLPESDQVPASSPDKSVKASNYADAKAAKQPSSQGSPESKGRDLASPSAFDEFVSKYPDYRGTKKEFTWALVYIEWLDTQDKTVHDFLCDDFIRILASDYKDYRDQTRDKDRTEILTGWKYYNKKVHAPVYLKGVIYEEIFSDILSSLDPEEVGRFRGRFNSQLSTMGPNSSMPTPTQPQLEQAITERSPENGIAAQVHIKNEDEDEVLSQLVSPVKSHEGNHNSDAGLASPELGSPTAFNRSHANASPSIDEGETRNERNLSPVRPPSRTKKPFFQTASQMAGHASAALFDDSPQKPDSPAPQQIVDSGKKRRSLPWEAASSFPPAKMGKDSAGRKSLPWAVKSAGTSNPFSPEQNISSSKSTPRANASHRRVSFLDEADDTPPNPPHQPRPLPKLSISKPPPSKPSNIENKLKSKPSHSPPSSTHSHLSVQQVSNLPTHPKESHVKEWLKEVAFPAPESVTSTSPSTSFEKPSKPPQSRPSISTPDPLSRVAGTHTLKRKSSFKDRAPELAKKIRERRALASMNSTPVSTPGMPVGKMGQGNGGKSVSRSFGGFESKKGNGEGGSASKSFEGKKAGKMKRVGGFEVEFEGGLVEPKTQAWGWGD